VGAQLLDGRHYVGGEDDGPAAAGVVGEDRPNVCCGDGVNSLEWFIEDEDTWGVNEGGCHRDFFRHAGRVLADQFPTGLTQIEGGEEFFGAFTGGRGVEAVQHGDVDEEVGAGETIEQAHAVGHDAEQGACPLRLCPYVDAVHVGGSAVGGQQAGRHREGGGFPCAVGADDPVEGPGGNVEGEVRDGDQVSVDFDEASDRKGDLFINDDGRERSGGGL
jgi:hypothetical protein